MFRAQTQASPGFVTLGAKAANKALIDGPAPEVLEQRSDVTKFKVQL